MPPAVASLLGLNLKFIPKPDYTTSTREIWEGLDRLERDLHLKIFFAGGEDKERSKLYVPNSEWRPDIEDIPRWLDNKWARFAKSIAHKFVRRHVRSNLLPFQRKLLEDLRRNHDVIIANTDKGLGPCAIELNRYILDALVHLLDESTYQILTEEEAQEAATKLREEIEDWLEEYESILEESDHTYILWNLLENKDPFGYFYLLYKIHKLPSLEGVNDGTIQCPTRPVCSSCGSLDHALGAWVNLQLQPVAQAQPTYFKNSQAALKMLQDLDLPDNAYLFTADATAMYPNIKTDAALEIIPAFLREHEKEFNYPTEALIDALQIVFKNNLFRFSDLFIKQVDGTVMGKRPSPPWATIFFGIHEVDLLRVWKAFLKFLKRFIDDILGIWLAHPDPNENQRLWSDFKAHVNTFHGLQWKFTPLAKSGVIFMDMKLSIVGGKIQSTIYEKDMALHLYIPPSSAHSPGVTNSIVMGNVLRIFQLCTDTGDIDEKLEAFFDYLLNRGHQLETLRPLFDSAIANATKYLATSEDEREATKAAKAEEAKRRVYFHVPFHPDNPKARVIQSLWSEHVAAPDDDKPLNKQVNERGAEVPVDKLIVCYHRPHNLGNLLSYRKIANRNGPKASSYL